MSGFSYPNQCPICGSPKSKYNCRISSDGLIFCRYAREGITFPDGYVYLGMDRNNIWGLFAVEGELHAGRKYDRHETPAQRMPAASTATPQPRPGASDFDLITRHKRPVPLAQLLMEGHDLAEHRESRGSLQAVSKPKHAANASVVA